MDNTSQSDPTHYTRSEWIQFGLFWSWNLIFLAFMSLGFAPIVLPETFTAVRTGSIPGAYLVYALILASIPVATVILGLTVLRRAPSRLFALGYVIEGPLMLMLAVRFFAIRQATLGLIIPMSIALLGMAAFLWTLLDLRAGQRRPYSEAIRLAGLTLMALTSLYAAVWIACYAIPIGFEVLRWLGSVLSDLPRHLRDLGQFIRYSFGETPLMLPFSVLGFILLLYTATLFVLTPIAVPMLSLRAWWRSLTRQVGQRSWLGPSLLVCLVIAASAGLFLAANRQPQAEAFALLDKPPVSTEEAQILLTRSDKIRSGLLNAYLAPFRYISAEGEVRHIRDIYENTFKMSTRKAFGVQRLYEGLASPLLYKPVHPQEVANLIDNRALVEEPGEAARLYQRFFDATIVDGERSTIVAAVRSTWSPDQAEAAWQAVDDREVHLVSQEVDIQEHADWADLELHEVYQNQTSQEQEVIYYFNLPESAVLTGVWLGNRPDKEYAFSFQVAPRGAAQAVYREQTRVMRDPALLAQTGPRQYRLRVYPVPPLVTTFDEDRSRTLVEAAPEMHMWLAWREMSAGDNWPLPRLAYLRNIYWDESTGREVNGAPFEAAIDDWLPDSLPVSTATTPLAHRVDFPGSQTVLAIPAAQADPPSLPENLRLALVLDRSYSMQAQADQVKTVLQKLYEMDNLELPVDVYLTASPYRGEEPSLVSLDALDLDQILYFGGQNAAQLIAQFEALRRTNGDRQYDAVVLLTDGSGYELGESDIEVPIPSNPVWVVHLGGEMPLGYDDQTLEAIQVSGGGVASDLDEALARLAVSMTADQAVISDLLDGYLWTVLPTSKAASAMPSNIQIQTHAADEPITALAARRLILAEMQRNRGTIDQLETLDALHALAMNYGIVTPYSSMIVLVADNQQVLLEQLSELDDRYQREVETLSDTTPRSPLPLSGVPEPHEWLLLGLAAALLIYIGYTKGTRLSWRLINRSL